MEFTKCMLFTTVWLMMQTATAKACVLDRNEQNKYPFVVRIFLHNQVLAHGSLITPLRVLSAYGPLDNIIGDIDKLEFFAQVLAKGENVQCTDKRRSMSHQLPDTCALGHPHTACWVMERPFLVTLNHPFLYTSLDDMSIDSINKHFQDTNNLEKCDLLVYDREDNSTSARLLPGVLTYIGLDTPEHKTWSDVACKGDDSCTRNNFYCINPNDQWPDSSWYEGAAILCRGIPMGILIAVVEDPNSKERRTQFTRLSFATRFQAWALQEWPTPPEPSRRTSTENEMSSFSKRTSTSSKATTPMSVNPGSITFPTTRTVSQSRIPSAPTMTHLVTTTQITTFIRTKPKKVKPHADMGSIRKISSILTLIFNAFLIACC